MDDMKKLDTWFTEKSLGKDSDFSEQDIRQAATAVVDAAVVCYEFRTATRVSEHARALLVRAVMQNPLLTGDLFQSDSDQFIH